MCVSCKVRDFVPFSFIKHVTLFAWATGRGKGHAGLFNAHRAIGSMKGQNNVNDLWITPNSANILYPSSPIDRPGGQQEQGHGVVLHDPGEVNHEPLEVEPSSLGCQ